MKTVSVSKLYGCNYSVNVVNSLRQYWRAHKTFDCIGEPKAKNMLLYLDGCKARYTMKDKSKLYAPSGSLVYIPQNCEYHVGFYDFENSLSNTVGINFYIYDEAGEPFVLSDSILIFDSINCKDTVEKINSAGEGSVICYGIMKAGVYTLLSQIGEENKIPHKFRIIEKGIRNLEKDLSPDISISDIAKMCNVSEIYFRRLFKEYAGISPVEYRIKSRIDRAKLHLEYSGLSIGEIAGLLGFTDVSYFCRQFRKYIGMTPLKYRLQCK